MTMKFRTIQQALVTILGDASASRYQVVGYQRQVKSAEEVQNTDRMVQVFFSQGEFPRSKGRLTGPVQHIPTFSIGLTVSAAANVDLSVINNPASSAAQIATALAAMQEAASVVDESFDELADIIYQILMDGLNYDLGLSKGSVSNRWVNSIRKDNPVPQGALLILTGSIEYEVQTAEDITGDTGTPANILSTTLDIDGDDVERTGVEVDNT